MIDFIKRFFKPKCCPHVVITPDDPSDPRPRWSGGSGRTVFSPGEKGKNGGTVIIIGEE